MTRDLEEPFLSQTYFCCCCAVKKFGQKMKNYVFALHWLRPWMNEFLAINKINLSRIRSVMCNVIVVLLRLLLWSCWGCCCDPVEAVVEVEFVVAVLLRLLLIMISASLLSRNVVSSTFEAINLDDEHYSVPVHIILLDKVVDVMFKKILSTKCCKLATSI